MEIKKIVVLIVMTLALIGCGATESPNKKTITRMYAGYGNAYYFREPFSGECIVVITYDRGATSQKVPCDKIPEDVLIEIKRIEK